MIARLVAFGALVLVSNSLSYANSILFSEDFSSNLAQWTGKSGGGHNGVITSDPLDPLNSVLSFSGLNISGDIFTDALFSSTGYSQLLVEFDYLGLPQPGSIAGNLGGFLGISIDLNPGVGAWLAGTQQSAANGLGFEGIELADDGQWHTYQIDISRILSANDIEQVHLMLEDWQDAGGVAGDAYFDNIRVLGARTVPDSGASGSLLLGAIAFCCFGLKLRQRLI